MLVVSVGSLLFFRVCGPPCGGLGPVTERSSLSSHPSCRAAVALLSLLLLLVLDLPHVGFGVSFLLAGAFCSGADSFGGLEPGSVLACVQCGCV